MDNNIKKKVFLLTILPLIIIFSITVSVMTIYYRNNLKEYEKFKTEEIRKEIEIATNTYRRFSDFIYYSTINCDEISGLLYESYTRPETKDSNRIKLIAEVNSLYNDVKKFEYRQLHFHLPDTESFLRMHRPSKYGDKLASVRETVRFTNENKTISTGFEEGRIFNGYRYVYPLYYKGLHAGSVEISISLRAVIKSLEELFEKKYIFLLKKELVDEKVFSSEKSNYKPFCVNSNYLLDIAVNRIEFCGEDFDDFLNNSEEAQLRRKLDTAAEFILPGSGEKIQLPFCHIKAF